jgi:phosphatidylglycerophosphate synthase
VRLPAWTTSDQLSLLALLSMAAAGGFFAAFRFTRWAPLGVIVALAANWFGDSLDGTLARVRRCERPRYGYYVDHVIDLAGIAMLFAGLACSTAMSPIVALALLVAYLLVAAQSFLATHVTAVFEMSAAGMGPTEMRIILAAGALKLLDTPWVSLGRLGHWRLFDVGGVVAAACLLVVFVASSARNARALAALEPAHRR